MSTERRYAIPVEQVEWPIPGAFDTVFRWEYEDARDNYTAYLKVIHDGKDAEEARKALERLSKLSSEAPKQ